MKYRHHFRVHAPLAAVANFHARSASVGAITPPPAVIRVHRAPPRLDNGDEMDFTLRLGPLRVHWLARIEAVSPNGFTDRQMQGPFHHWVHRHSYEPIDEGTTAVVDQIELTFRPHLLWGLIGIGIWLSLPLLFAYRGWKTRQLLETRPS